MRQCEVDDIVTREILQSGVDEREMRERAQVRLDRDQRLARVLVRGHRDDVEFGVIGEESEQLTPGIAAGTCHGDGESHSATLRERDEASSAATLSASCDQLRKRVAPRVALRDGAARHDGERQPRVLRKSGPRTETTTAVPQMPNSCAQLRIVASRRGGCRAPHAPARATARARGHEWSPWRRLSRRS